MWTNVATLRANKEALQAEVDDIKGKMGQIDTNNTHLPNLEKNGEWHQGWK